MTTPPITQLRIVLYPLYYVDDLDGFVELTPQLEKTLPPDHQPAIDALRWICANPSADLRRVLPNLPHSNENIHKYAHALLRQLTGQRAQAFDNE